MLHNKPTIKHVAIMFIKVELLHLLTPPPSQPPYKYKDEGACVLGVWRGRKAVTVTVCVVLVMSGGCKNTCVCLCVCLCSPNRIPPPQHTAPHNTVSQGTRRDGRMGRAYHLPFWEIRGFGPHEFEPMIESNQ